VADIKKVIGDRIRDLRRDKGLSQIKLGSKAKLHYTYIGSVERGEKNVSVESLDKIAKGLGVGIPEILNVSKKIKNPIKLRASMAKEINKSDPEILKIVLDLIRQLNALKLKSGPSKGLKQRKTPRLNSGRKDTNATIK
jgi:transcriptional regulator with XRE-family HTH domain